MKWTADQERVINTRDCDLLVSAAAGSGKTAVLVERILRRITDMTHPINIDELLVVTFTNAAAAQMKEKITEALYKRLEECPTDEHLTKQLTIIHRANITTIDSFCLQVVREHFQLLGLDPGFQIAEAPELAALSEEVLSQVLEEAYEAGEENFLAFIDGYGGDKSDKTVEVYIQNIAKKADSYADPYGWLQKAGDAMQFSDFGDVEKQAWYVHFMTYMYHMLDMYALDAQFLQTLCSREPGLSGFAQTCIQDIALIRELQVLVEKGRFQDFCQAMDVQWPRAAVIKKDSVEEALALQVKKARAKYKDAISGLQKHLHTNEEFVLKELHNIAGHMRVLLDLTERYMRRLDERKLSEGMLDFSDIEHYAFRILADENGPTAVAKTYRNKFKEIMIDEYQDSNFLQEDILSAISGISAGMHNMFMVGDVKQSIYRFRMARPDLFMDKYHKYILAEDENILTENAVQRRIELKTNFRSRSCVLEAVNYIFYQLMGEDFGGIAYDASAALVPGYAFPDAGDIAVSDSTELMLLDLSAGGEQEENRESGDEQQRELDKTEQEAHMVAQRILELVGERGNSPLYVLSENGEGYRKAAYKDIAILMRSLSGAAAAAPVFLRVLAEYGIPAVSELSIGLMNTQEICTLLACLSVIHNPYTDIELVTVMHSPMFGFTDEELARIRVFAKEQRDVHMQEDFYHAVYAARETNPKIAYFYERLDDWQAKSQYMDAASLLWDILEKTKYLLYLQALDGGERRVANVYYLISCARSFSVNGQYSVYEFLQYIRKLKDAKLDLGEANVHGEHDDIVRIMSMHKSKGLEFPVVFVSCLGKQFNLRETSEQVIVHADDYLAAHYVDAGLRMRKKSFMHFAFAENMKTEDIAEEFRVLYVAMTRAKEKLILTGSCADLKKQIDMFGKLSRFTERRLPFGYRRKAQSYLEWILMALIRNRKFYETVIRDVLEVEKIRAVFSENMLPADFKLQVQVVTKHDLALANAGRQALKLVNLVSYRAMQEQPADAGILEALRGRMEYRYPFATVTDKKAKYSVSELKAAGGTHEKLYYVNAGQMNQENNLSMTVPVFMQPPEELTGAGRGTLIHRIMQLLDFSKCKEKDSVEGQLLKWVAGGILPENTIESVNMPEFRAFFASELGQAMTCAEERGSLYKEKQFTILVPLSHVEEVEEADVEEQVLVQGIIDAYYEQEDGSIVVVDYKTDKGELPIDQYTKQITYYAEALERLTHKRIAAGYIYWFTQSETIRVYGED